MCVWCCIKPIRGEGVWYLLLSHSLSLLCVIEYRLTRRVFDLGSPLSFSHPISLPPICRVVQTTYSDGEYMVSFFSLTPLFCYRIPTRTASVWARCTRRVYRSLFTIWRRRCSSSFTCLASAISRESVPSPKKIASEKRLLLISLISMLLSLTGDVKTPLVEIASSYSFIQVHRLHIKHMITHI